MAAPTAVDSAVSNPGGTGSTLTVILPSTQAVGDVIYAWITNSGNTLWAGNPAGWSRKDQRTVGTSSNGLVGTLLFRTLVSGDTLPLTNPVCTLGATVTREAVAWTERGADVQGVHVLTEWGMNGHATGTANPIRPPTVITSSPEMHAIHCYGQRSATNAPEPTGYTQLTNGQVVISGTLVTNVSTKTVADQQTSLANQDASPTSGARWVACILCIPSPDYAYFRSTSQTLTSGGGVTGTLPTGTTDADVNGRAEGMLAIVKAAGSGVTITPTGGEWADVAGWDIDTSTGSDSIEVFAAEYSVGISLNFGRSGSGGIALRLITYRNIHQTDFIGNSNARQNAGTPAPWDAQARQNTKSTIVAIICADADTNSVHVPPGGYLERGDNFGIGAADQVFNATGTTASASWTTTNAANVAGLVELLSHAGVGPTVVIPTTANLSLSTFAPTVSSANNVTVVPTTASLTLSTFAPSVLVSVSVTPTTSSLSLTTFAPTVTTAVTVTPNTASLTLQTFAPSVEIDVTATPTTAVLALSSFAPKLAESLTPATSTLLLGSFAPSLTIAVTPAPQSLTLTVFAPSLQQSVVPSTSSLTLTTFAPSLVTPTTVIPSPLSLTINTFAPTISTDQGTAIPATLSLTLATFAPVVVASITVTSQPASLTLTSFAPNLSLQIIPATGTLVITGMAPNVSVSGGQDVSVTPVTATLVLTTYAPVARTFISRGTINIGQENRTIEIGSESRRSDISFESRVL